MDSRDYEFLSSENLAMAEVNLENAQEEQFQENVLEPPQVQELLQPEAQIAQGQQLMMREYLAEQAHVQAENTAAVHKQMETIRLAMKDLTEQAEVSKKLARKVVLDKVVASVNQASSRRSVRYYGF